MAELTPRFDPESFVDTDDVKDGKKKKKRKSIAGLGVIAATPDVKTPDTPKSKPERPKITLDALFGVETSLDKATNTYTTKPEAARKTRVAESIEEADTVPTVAGASEAVSDGTGADKTETTPSSRTPEVYELKPSELGGGEFIINLRDNPRPAAETVPTESDATAETIGASAEYIEPGQAADSEPIEPNAPEAAVDTTPEPIEATTATLPPAPPVKPTVNAWRRPGSRTARPSASPTAVTTTPFSPTPLPGGSGNPPSGGGNLPPFNPNMPYYQPASPNTPSTSPGAVNPNILRQIDDAEQDGRTRGRREGLFAGLLVGGGIEHVRHKRRERRMDKKLAATEKKHAKVLEDLHWDGVREKVAEKARADVNRPERSSKQSRRFEASAVAPGRSTTSEQLRAPQPEVQQVLTKQEKAEEVRRQLAAELQADAEQLKVPEGHRVEQSAWHTVEVDERGKTVEDSVINYGHEYYQERSRESAPVDHSQFKNITGSVALTAAALADDQAEASTATATSDAQMQANHAKSHLSMTKRATQALTSPPDTVVGIVPWVIALLVIVIAILFAL